MKLATLFGIALISVPVLTDVQVWAPATKDTPKCAKLPMSSVRECSPDPCRMQLWIAVIDGKQVYAVKPCTRPPVDFDCSTIKKDWQACVANFCTVIRRSRSPKIKTATCLRDVPRDIGNFTLTQGFLYW